MGTRAYIAMENEDGSFDGIYTHWDGYPDHHMPILKANYNTTETVKELLALGSLSVLAEKIGEKHDFDSKEHDDQCLAYGRDRGEEETGARHFETMGDMISHAKEAWAEHAYIFNKGKWKHYKI